MNNKKPREDNNSTKIKTDDRVFDIDPRTLGRPLNIARNNLISRIQNGRKSLVLAINSMTRRRDAKVHVREVSIEMQAPAPLHPTPVYFSHHQHQGLSMLEVTPNLLSPLADAFYGGNPSFSAEAETDMSSIELNSSEQRVQARLSAVVLNQLDSAWHSPKQASPLESCCLHVQFDISIGDVHGALSMQLDDNLLIALGKPHNPITATPEEINERRSKQLRHVPVCLNAVLAQQTMSLDQVTQLKVGDIISADVQEIVEVSSGAQKLFLARVSEQNNHLVLQITDHINPAENFPS